MIQIFQGRSIVTDFVQYGVAHIPGWDRTSHMVYGTHARVSWVGSVLCRSCSISLREVGAGELDDISAGLDMYCADPAQSLTAGGRCWGTR